MSWLIKNVFYDYTRKDICALNIFNDNSRYLTPIWLKFYRLFDFYLKEFGTRFGINIFFTTTGINTGEVIIVKYE